MRCAVVEGEHAVLVHKDASTLGNGEQPEFSPKRLAGCRCELRCAEGGADGCVGGCAKPSLTRKCRKDCACGNIGTRAVVGWHCGEPRGDVEQAHLRHSCLLTRHDRAHNVGAEGARLSCAIVEIAEADLCLRRQERALKVGVDRAVLVLGAKALVEIVQREVALAWLERAGVGVKGLDASRVKHIAGLVVKDAIAVPVNLQFDNWTMLFVGNRGDQVCAKCHGAS